MLFRKIFFSIFLLFVVSLVSAQNGKKNFTIDEIIKNGYTELRPTSLRYLNWIPGTIKFSYVDEKSNLEDLFIGDALTGKKASLLNIKTLNVELSRLGLKSIKKIPYYSWTSDSTLTFWNKKTFLVFNVKSSRLNIITKLPNGAKNIKVSRDSKKVAFTLGNNLFYMNGKTQVQITKEISNEIVSGQSVSRREFGIKDGIFWSPKSNYIAFYQKDESNVSNYPLVDYKSVPAKVEYTKYPMAGSKSELVKVGIFNLNTGATSWFENSGSNEDYYTCITWDPTEDFIYSAILKRDQKHLSLNKYSSKDGKFIKTLFEESNEKFVEPEDQLYFLENQKDKFIWISERDNWRHMYLYDTDGKLFKQITKGPWIVYSIVGYNPKTNDLYYSSSEISPLGKQIYKINIATNDKVIITPDRGIHRLNPNSNYNYFIDFYSSSKTPNEIRVLDSKYRRMLTIHRASNPLVNYNLGNTEIYTIESDSGDVLYCREIYPPDFDPAKIYPVVVYVYGGPHAQLIKNNWPVGRYALWFQYMAQHGYIVFTIDNRGSDNRGLNFEQATFRQLGTVEIADQLKGIEHLKSQPFIDQDRIGVFGWSYGGFMTTSLMLRTNNTYKVGVAGGAVIDWKYYEVMYTERYMDTPETNPLGFQNASLLNRVQNLKGKLLLVHGTSDPTVVIQNTYSFAKKASDLNIPLDYYPYIGHGHGVSGIDAIQLYNKISNYFFDNL